MNEIVVRIRWKVDAPIDVELDDVQFALDKSLPNCGIVVEAASSVDAIKTATCPTNADLKTLLEKIDRQTKPARPFCANLPPKGPP